jgi:hypothetical protein
MAVTLKGMIGVNVGANRCSALAALAIAVALCGCSNIDLDSSQPWFRKPFELFGQTGGYTFSDVQEQRRDRPITANDLIEANGSCPPPAAPPPAPSSQVASPAATPASAPDAAPVLGEGISLGMSECEVVYSAGQPSNVQLGKNPNGDRTAVLTFQGGPRPGIYRFEGGRLMEMDRVEEPAPPPQAAKKKPAKTKQSAKANTAT